MVSRSTSAFAAVALLSMSGCTADALADSNADTGPADAQSPRSDASPHANDAGTDAPPAMGSDARIAVDAGHADGGSDAGTTDGGRAASSAKPFPRFGVQSFVGNQLPDSAHLSGLASYPWILLGGDFPSAVGGAKLTRDQIVTGLKGQAPTGKNAVQPLVFQYQDDPNIVKSGEDNTPELSAAANTNNWWLYMSGSSGAMPTQDNFKYINPSHGGGSSSIAAIGKDVETGLWPFEYASQYSHDRYITGGGLATATSGEVMASASLDGFYCDNLSAYIRVSGDWLRDGTTQSGPSGTSAAIAALMSGQADMADHWRAIDSSRSIIGNVAWVYGVSSLGLDGTPMKGKFDYPMQQFMWGRGAPTVFVNHGFAFTMNGYKALIGSSANDTCTMTGQFEPADYQTMRHGLGMTLMDNGYFIAGVSPTGTYDGVDGTDPATWPAIDEFWGGSLSLGGYLGNPAATAQGAPQTAAWSSGVWRRDFDNGIVLVNSSAAASPIVTLDGTFYHLKTRFGSQALNDGSLVTSLSIAGNDSVVLLRVAPPP
jgi:hypothetical protein